MVTATPVDVCRIEYHDVGGMTRLSAVLIPSVAREGTYQFIVRSVSDGGTSSNAQGGEFSARGGHREDLSKIIVGGGMSVQKSVAEKWEKLTGKHLLEGYGQSRTKMQ